MTQSLQRLMTLIEVGVDIEQLVQKGIISTFVYNRVNKELLNDSRRYPDILSVFVEDMSQLSCLDINDDYGFEIACSIQSCLKDVVNSVLLGKCSHHLFIDILRHLYESFDKSWTMKDLFSRVVKYCSSKNVPMRVAKVYTDKDEKVAVAYPVGVSSYNSFHRVPVYNTNKWVEFTNNVYSISRRTGESISKIIDRETEDWDKVEKFNYNKWLSYYTSGSAYSYSTQASSNPKTVKIAQYIAPDILFNNGEALKSTLPLSENERVSRERAVYTETAATPPIEKKDPRDIIEGQRSKILSRLYSAEKMLSSIDGQIFAGDQQDVMLQLLQDLKRKVQTANKINVKSSLFEDFIFRAANWLEGPGGFKKGAVLLKKIAQDEMGGFEDGDEGLEQSELSPEDVRENSIQAFREFLEATNKGHYDDPDTSKGFGGKDRSLYERKVPSTISDNSTEQVMDPFSAAPMPDGSNPFEGGDMFSQAPIDTGSGADVAPEAGGVPEPATDPVAQASLRLFVNMIEKFAKELDEDEIIVTAQDVLQPSPDANVSLSPPSAPAQQVLDQQVQTPISSGDPGDIVIEDPDDLIETEEDLVIEEDDTDDVIEKALNSITIEDAVNRLEMLVAVYKKRDIARQLSILDIMMDHLGLGSYFPSLGEAMAKALESNQYISTRIEDVLTRLKGSAESAGADKWINDHRKSRPDTPEVSAIKDELSNRKQVEEEARRARKERENKKLLGDSAETKQEEAEPEANSGIGEEIQKIVPQQPAVQQATEPVTVR